MVWDFFRHMSLHRQQLRFRLGKDSLKKPIDEIRDSVNLLRSGSTRSTSQVFANTFLFFFLPSAGNCWISSVWWSQTLENWDVWRRPWSFFIANCRLKKGFCKKKKKFAVPPLTWWEREIFLPLPFNSPIEGRRMFSKLLGNYSVKEIDSKQLNFPRFSAFVLKCKLLG